MVWLNQQHINRTPPPGYFGGARCTCPRCSTGKYIPPTAEELAKEISPNEKTFPKKTENRMKKTKLAKLILKIIDDHSGGCKECELKTELVCQLDRLGKRPTVPQFLKQIEQAIKELPEIGVLEYSMILGKMTRRKRFFYRRTP